MNHLDSKIKSNIKIYLRWRLGNVGLFSGLGFSSFVAYGDFYYLPVTISLKKVERSYEEVLLRKNGN